MTIIKNISRSTAVVAAVLVAAVLVAACGSSSSSGSGSKATASTARSAFTTCLKQHGVKLSGSFAGRGGHFPGAGGGGGAGAGGAGTGGAGAGATGAPPSGAGGSGNPPAGGGFPGAGGSFGNSKFRAAFKDCASKLPKGARGGFGAGAGGLRGGGAGAGGARPHFSAKTLDSFVSCIRRNGYAAMPAANTTGKGAVFSSSVEANPKFKKALPKCESILTKGFRAPAGGSTNTTSGT